MKKTLSFSAFIITIIIVTTIIITTIIITTSIRTIIITISIIISTAVSVDILAQCSSMQSNETRMGIESPISEIWEADPPSQDSRETCMDRWSKALFITVWSFA